MFLKPKNTKNSASAQDKYCTNLPGNGSKRGLFGNVSKTDYTETEYF